MKFGVLAIGVKIQRMVFFITLNVIQTRVLIDLLSPKPNFHQLRKFIRNVF